MSLNPAGAAGPTDPAGSPGVPGPAHRGRAARIARLLALLAAAAVLLLWYRGPIAAWFTGAPLAGGSPTGPVAAASGRATSGGRAGAPAIAGGAGEIAFYACSMHPSSRQARPGKCPICGMDLVPVRRGEAASGVVLLDDGRRQEIGIRTGLVERRRLDDHLHALGKVAFDESRFTDVTVKVAGFAATDRPASLPQVGQRVERGQTLFTLYSPEIYLAELDYLAAVASQRAARPTAVPDRADYLVAAAAQRLRLWDVDEAEINRLNERGEAAREVAIRSPRGGVVIEKDLVQGAAVQPGMKLFRIAGMERIWVEATVYQADLLRVRRGQSASVSLPGRPGEEIHGRVALISPTLDPASRTAQVRIDLAGAAPRRAGALLPNMTVDVELGTRGGEALVVPEGAVLATGNRSVVFVDEGAGRFRARDVRLGPRSGDVYPVLGGLAAGDRVVTSGQFLLDAEVRLRGAAGGPRG